ncbi:hypothetical protein ACET3X_006191 [Alternaria dauci]|uniref:Clr5 domain-containing protein n=1 Tax=Alternaria dauci TaxID=48095 RepID=A0ABR3UHK5_9PLEO
MASVEGLHADVDTHAMDSVTPSRSPPIGQASAFRPKPSIEPSTPKRIERSEWDKHERFIRANHHRMQLTQLRRAILMERGFVASEQQWKKALARWGLCKSIPKSVAKFIGKKTHFRQAREGKKTTFRYRKQTVPKDKIKRYEQEYAKGDLSPIPTSPSNLTYQTLKSPTMAFTLPVNQSPKPPHMEFTLPADQTSCSNMSVRTEFYNGQDLDSFLASSHYAQALAKQGNYTVAKLSFIDALEGIEALIGAVHMITIDVLDSFAEAAIQNKDYGGATELLRKSHTQHQELLGRNHKKTWASFGRLGLVQLAEGKRGQALKTFMDAKSGIRAAPDMSQEDIFNLTIEFTLKIVDVRQKLCDFEGAVSELCDLIQESEALGDAYRNQTAALKHRLAHLYNDEVWSLGLKTLPFGVAAAPRQRVENNLLEAINDYEATFSEDPHYLCSLEQLRVYYENAGEVFKLDALIKEKIEPAFVALRPTGQIRDKYIKLMQGAIVSLSRLREFERAEMLLKWRQQQIEGSDKMGYFSFEALSNVMLHAKCYLDRKMPESAEPLLEKAQQIAMRVLPLGHTFHEVLAQTIAGKAWLYETCHCCLVNPPGEFDSASWSGDYLGRH